MAVERLVSLELHADHPAFLTFVHTAQAVVDSTADRHETVSRLQAPFVELLANQEWLPDQYAHPCATGGMGSGIGNYLLYRAPDRTLSVSALVLPPGAQTPVHDHLTWGIVGLYRGEQDEEVFQRLDDESRAGKAQLTLVETRSLKSGDYYHLFPPDGDIHRVVCGANVPSISIHVLGRDVGCIWRHHFDLEHNTVDPFRSGYVNVKCPEDQT